MKKVLLLVMAIALNSFADYIDVGLGVGGAYTHIDKKSVEKPCETDCKEMAVDVSFRIANNLTEKLLLGAEISLYGNRYYNLDHFTQYNTFFLGPTLIYFPTERFQLSTSVGLTKSGNVTDEKRINLHDDGGAGVSLAAGYHFGGKNGVLVGVKLYDLVTDIEVENNDNKSKKRLNTAGASVFVHFSHK